MRDDNSTELKIRYFTYLRDPIGIFDIESISMLLYLKLERSKVLLVQLTGTMTANARKAIGTKILSLQLNRKKRKGKVNPREQ